MFFVQDSWIAQSANDTLVLTSAQGHVCRYRLRSGQLEYKASPLSLWAVLTPNQTMQHLAINTAVGKWLREKSRWNLGPQLSQTASFMVRKSKPLSRQRLWQKKVIAEGRCSLCGRKRPKELKVLCRSCQDKVSRYHLQQYYKRKAEQFGLEHGAQGEPATGHTFRGKKNPADRPPL